MKDFGVLPVVNTALNKQSFLPEQRKTIREEPRTSNFLHKQHNNTVTTHT